MRPVPRGISWGPPAGPAQAGEILQRQDGSRLRRFRPSIPPRRLRRSRASRTTHRPRLCGFYQPAQAGRHIDPAYAVPTNPRRRDDTSTRH
ncbi:hypothetical protein CC2G_014315 [Coprinopsis cinerea AmutBmut pab1-1]|nr:hypothetical protein CC2G_014315 [Coprinopsis cinerea AmutBmut pab1-1]